MLKRRLQKIQHQSSEGIQIDDTNEQQQQQIDVDRKMAIDEEEQSSTTNNRELNMKYHLLGKTDLGNKTLRNNTDTVEDTTAIEGGEDNSDFNNGVGHEEFSVHILNNNEVEEGEEASAEWENDTNVIIDIGGEGSSSNGSEEGIQERAYTDGNTANNQFSVFILDTAIPTTSTPTTTLTPTTSPTITNSPSIITPPTTHLQSLHKTLKNYADHLKQLEKLHAGEILHDKSSFNGIQNGGAHKNAENREENRPIRWTPPDDTSEENIQEAPRAPDSDDQYYDSSGKINCKSSNGQYGNRIGGVVVRYQYEITFEKRVLNSNEGLGGVLPGVEHGMSDLLLPIFFHEECLRIDHDDNGNDNVGATGRELTTLPIEEEGMDEVEQVWEEFGGILLSPSPQTSEEGGRGLLRGHRRLNKVVGVDSAPRDFPLADKGEYLLVSSL